MSGFGKTAGPTPSTSSQPRFGPPPSSFPSPPSPPPPRYAPRGYEAAPQAVRPLQAVRPPQFSYQSSSGLAPRGYQPSGIPRRPEGFGGVRSPPVPGQSTRPIGSPSYSSVRPNKFVNDQRSLFNDDAQTNSRRPVTSVVASRSSGNSVTAKISRSQDLKRTRPPFLHSSYEGISRQQTSFQRPALAARARDSLPNLSENYSNFTSPQDSFPVSPYAGSYDSGKRFRNETVEVNGPKQSKSLPRPSATEVLQENTPFAQSRPSGSPPRLGTRPSGSPPRLGTRLNDLSNAYDPQMSQRPSPVKDPQISQRSSPSVTGIGEATPSRTVGFPVAKRTRSPPSPSINKFSQGNSDSTQDDAEREMHAKARRLARFKEELSHNFESESTPDVADQNLETSRQMKPAMEFTNGNTSSDFEGMETSNAIIGLCPDMCPESERAERERKGDLDRYERLDGDRNQTNKFLAIKKYTRTAEREASLIRPMPILQKTVDYLLHLLDQPYDDRFLRMYNFLWDRMRAVRMDLRMQHIFNQGAITMLEQMIRLHIIAMHELCEYTKGEGFSEGFDAHLNIEQMNKTSVELFQMYDDHRKRGIDVPSEKEFRGYYALLKLDKHPGYKVEPAELSLDLAKMTPNIRQTPEVLFARDVARACRTSNFIIFFRLARKATYLQACLMHAHFAKLRTQALASLHSGVQMNQGIPIAQVAQWLAMEEEEIQSLLEYHGFVIKEFEEPYMVKECSFLNSEKDYPTKCSKLVHLKKLSRIVGDVSPMPSVVPLPTQTAKKQQLPKIYRHETKAAPSASVDKSKSVNQIDNAFVGRRKYVSEIDEEMLDFRAASSPKVSAPLKQSMEENSMAKQKRQADPKVVDAYFSPQSFSSQQKFIESQAVKFGVPERQNLGGSHASPERVSSPKTSSASLQEWLPSAKYGNGLVEDVSSPRTSRASLLERLPSGRYGNTLMEGVSSPRTPKVSLQERFPSGISNTMENSNTETVGFSSSEVEETAITQVEENNVVENYNEEVAQAKLRLIVRLWRRHSSRLKELRQQRHIAANAALNSLSLGPPIRQARDQPSAASEFDIDHVMRERCRKYEESWSKLNVSDVIVDILDRRNPNTGFLCWKMILCNQMGDKLEQSSKVTQVAAGSWLFSKLLPPRKDDDSSDDDLLISYPGLAIWKQWVPSTSDSDLICCMSIVRDINSDDVNETTAGASAVLFLASESIPWNLQKAQLHNLLLSVPSGSSLPLLVLSDSKQDLSSVSTIVSELGLNDVDESRISSFRVVFLVEDNQMEHVDGFFSDTQLREGIRWLASESPLQPDLHCITTRDLVLSHLNPAMQVLERLSDYEVRPNHCISAFNEALDLSLEKIDAAAKANPTGWPCPEIDLLEGLCDEHVVVKWHLPSTRWSSASSIEPLLCAVRECKLPSLPDSISWSGKSAYTGAEIENLRSQLENCITKYLTQSSGMMGSLLAAKEAHVMLQRSARLELHDSSYYIVPKWVMVFRRIFNWRLTSLSNGTYSSAYVLMGDDVRRDSEVTDELGYEEDRAFFPYLSQPSLDEVIDAGCSPLLLRGQPEPEALQRPQTEVSDGDIRTASNANNLVPNDRDSENSSNLMENERAKLLGLQKYESMSNGVDRTSLKVVSSNKVKEAGNNDRLNKLLEQCNIVQNSIEQKLFIYF